ncbi:MAG: hypothetical protein JNM17_14860 [Archangium sp.]|nr:hypothetical protein [Archangium sp.]
MTLALLLTLALAAEDGGGIPASQNLLREARVMKADGAPNAALLADGIASVDGDVWDNPRSALFAKGGVIEWELVQISPVRNLRIQADNNDFYTVSGSVDGTNWFVLWTAGPVDLPGVQTRTAPELQGLPVRFLRLTADRGDNMYSITELEVYDSPAALRASTLKRIDPAPPPPPPTPPPFDTGFVVVFVVLAAFVYYVSWARRRNRVLGAPATLVQKTAAPPPSDAPAADAPKT